MSKSPNMFKKKNVFDFSNNGLMVSSVRTPKPSFSDEAYLNLEKEIRKLNKSHKQLLEKYEKMKNYSIEERQFSSNTRVDLVINLQKATNHIKHLEEEKGMFISRIKYLQKEANAARRNYERPLGRSINKSAVKYSKAYHPIIQSSMNLALKTERSQTSQNSLDEMNRKERFLTINDDQLKSSQLIQESTAQKFKIQKSKKALISDENESQTECYCGNQKCLKNYEELQYLRKELNLLADQMEQIYFKIQYEVDRRSNPQQVIDYKLKIESLIKNNPNLDFFYKGKPEFLISRIQQKLEEFVNSTNYKVHNPLIAQVKEKLKQIQLEEEAMMEEFEFQSYDFEFQQKEIEKIAENQHRMFMGLKQELITSGSKNPKLLEAIKHYEDSREGMWKKAGIQLKLQDLQ